MTPSHRSDEDLRWMSWIEKGRRRDEILANRMRWLGWAFAVGVAALVVGAFIN